MATRVVAEREPVWVGSISLRSKCTPCYSTNVWQGVSHSAQSGWNVSYAGNLIMAELLWSLHSQCRERRKQRERGRETVPSRGSRFSQTNCILRQLHFDNLRLIYTLSVFFILSCFFRISVKVKTWTQTTFLGGLK